MSKAHRCRRSLGRASAPTGSPTSVLLGLLAIVLLSAVATGCPPVVAPPGGQFATVDDAVSAGVVDPEIVASLSAGGAPEVVVQLSPSGAPLPRDEDGNEIARSADEIRAEATAGAERLAALDVAGATAVIDLPNLGIRIATVNSSNSVLRLANGLGVKTVKKNPKKKITDFTVAPAPSTDSQGLVRQPLAFVKGATGAEQVVAVIDSGDHGDVVSRRVTEMAPQAVVRMYSLPNPNGTFAGDYTPSDVLQQMELVISDKGAGQNIVVVNLSLGGDECSGGIDRYGFGDAIARLRQVGVTAVAASGNNGVADRVLSPACLGDVIAVGSSYPATRSDVETGGSVCTETPRVDQASCQTNTGPELDIYGPNPDGFTSFATPTVSRAAAAIMSTVPGSCWSHLPAALASSHVRVTDPDSGRAVPRLDLEDARESIRERCGLVADRIAVGSDASCLITASRNVKCWGANDVGQLGRGAVSSQTVSATNLTTVKGVAGAAQVGAGAGFACARTVAAGVKCWGRNTSGQVGTGSSAAQVPLPEAVVISSVSDLAVGRSHVCAVAAFQRVQCWGSNSSGQLGGGGASADEPVLVPLALRVTDVEVSSRSSCALTVERELWCWGFPYPAQPRLVTVDGPTSLRDGGDFGVCGIYDAGDVRCTLSSGLPPAGSTFYPAPQFAGASDVSGGCARDALASVTCARRVDGVAHVVSYPALAGAGAIGASDTTVCGLVGPEGRPVCTRR